MILNLRIKMSINRVCLVCPCWLADQGESIISRRRVNWMLYCDFVFLLENLGFSLCLWQISVEIQENLRMLAHPSQVLDRMVSKSYMLMTLLTFEATETRCLLLPPPARTLPPLNIILLFRPYRLINSYGDSRKSWHSTHWPDGYPSVLTKDFCTLEVVETGRLPHFNPAAQTDRQTDTGLEFATFRSRVRRSYQQAISALVN